MTARLLWPGLAALSLILAALVAQMPGWALLPPAALHLDMAAWVSAAMVWLVEQATFGLFTVKQATRALAAMIEWPYEAARVLLVDGITEGRGRKAVTLVPPLSWIAVTVAMGTLGVYARNLWLGLGVGALFLYLAVFGQWESAMITLASIVIAVPIGVMGGLVLGVAAYLSPRFDRLQSPVLDLMQTVPTFAYLVPILFLFGFGPVAALLATVIYAMPPMVRITTLALRSIPPEINDFARMVGCTGWQRLRKVLLPAALPDLMVGVNQVIMLSLNMVIIASMIGAGGLGFDVLNALRRLDIGAGVEAGLAITALAVALDRLSQALALRAGLPDAATGSWIKRHPKTLAVLALVLATGLLGLVWPWLQTYPKAGELSTKAFWSDLVKSININYFDQLEAWRTFVLTYMLLPVKRFLLALPWPWVVALVTLAGWQLGRARLAALCLGLSLFLVAAGLWEQAMTTVYLCGVSVVVAVLVGLPLGVLAASNATAGKVIGGVIDTLQTLPSFVYLIPVVMLFRVGDFSAMTAVVLYALAPAVRYTAHGLRAVPEELVEAGTVCGCTPWQVLTRIRLPMALPDILLGVNQTIMLALSMLVITALVGTRDLGQEVYIALTRADTGAGIVAGVCVAALAIIADRLIAAGAAQARARLGMGGDA
ncbi:ABC transporter permease [Rhodobacter ferrooxidans]|uniref:Binding-protein-dependent transport systems inner membrane component n=1 Tax=Rhodobacter ferrooxidans TaxID=371731 RepID=C8RZ95_9RHOB|nr:ABC transporter permease subunit [Rhodobacter sp. SW2]EEW26052.1 binding-protein-dependent transport systems inner membrane component [Rhodobacter sp. SW2]